MTATNHALAGAAIGLSITQPVLALPLALASHFVMDAIPHFGIKFTQSKKNRKIFHSYLLIDAALLATIIISLYLTGAGWLVFACLFLAGCPDFFQAYNYLFDKKFRASGVFTNPGRYARFSKGIQKESVKGLYIEIPLAILLAIFVFSSV